MAPPRHAPFGIRDEARSARSCGDRCRVLPIDEQSVGDLISTGIRPTVRAKLLGVPQLTWWWRHLKPKGRWPIQPPSRASGPPQFTSPFCGITKSRRTMVRSCVTGGGPHPPERPPGGPGLRARRARVELSDWVLVASGFVTSFGVLVARVFGGSVGARYAMFLTGSTPPQGFRVRQTPSNDNDG